MTKSTITRDRLQELAEGQSGFNLRTATHEESQELARMALSAMDSEPVAYILKHPAGRLLWSLTDESNKGHDDVMPVYANPQPAPVSLTEAQVAALEKEEKSFHDAIRKCIASLRYHHKRAEAHSTGYKGSTLEDDTLKSINFLKRNITAAMLNGGKS